METLEEIVLKISKEMDLDSYNAEMLEHDIRNLRGEEWDEDIKNECSAQTYKAYRKLVKNAGKLYV